MKCLLTIEVKLQDNYRFAVTIAYAFEVALDAHLS